MTEPEYRVYKVGDLDCPWHSKKEVIKLSEDKFLIRYRHSTRYSYGRRYRSLVGFKYTHMYGLEDASGKQLSDIVVMSMRGDYMLRAAKFFNVEKEFLEARLPLDITKGDDKRVVRNLKELHKLDKESK